jgi:hypothetical protein
MRQALGDGRFFVAAEVWDFIFFIQLNATTYNNKESLHNIVMNTNIA